MRKKIDLKWRNDQQVDDCKIVIVEHYQGTLVTIAAVKLRMGFSVSYKEVFPYFFY